MAKKAVEWKDTRLPWCVEREYSLMTKNRCVFFHGFADRYIKSLNFAAKFAAPNRVCVLYLYGAVANEETLRRRIGQVGDQLLVILVPIDSEVIEVRRGYEALLERLSKGGLTKEMILDTVHHCEAAIASGQIDGNNGLYLAYKDYIEMLQRGEENERTLAEQQGLPCRALSNFCEEVVIEGDHDAALLRMIRQIYPLGVEASAPDEQGAKVLAMRRLIATALTGDETEIVERCCGVIDDGQMSFFAEAESGAARMIEDVQRIVDHKLGVDGCCDVGDLLMTLRRPPYGMYGCNYYAYVFARGMRQAIEGAYIYDGVAAWRMGTRIDTAEWLRQPYGLLMVQDDVDRQMAEAMGAIFDFTLEPGETFFDALTQVRKWCQEHLQEPLDLIDHRWLLLLRGDDTMEEKKQHRDKLMRRPYRHGFRDWLCSDVEGHRRRVRSTRDIVYERYQDRAKVDLYYRFYTVKGGAAGWLWNAEDFLKRMDRYMSACVCRECGREIESRFKTGEVYNWHDPQTDTECRFTKKDTIGLNKKFLGRVRDEYFCIPCLAEVVGCSVGHLYERMHEFKEQGCTLF